MSTNEGRVYFALDGDDFEPDELTEFLGIQPTSVRRKGERIRGRIPKISSWELSTEKVVNDYVDVFEMASDVVKRLKSKEPLIIEAKNRFNVTPRLEVVLCFSMNEEHSTPAIGFEIETVEFLGAVGAFVDIDTYKH